MHRDPDSHKGQNGRVVIIGGSPTIHGAPLFSALAAEASGVDLVFVCLPACHATLVRGASLNFQVHPFADDQLSNVDVNPILELLNNADVAVIGPGIGTTQDELESMKTLLSKSPCPLVVDATALQPWTFDILKGKTAVVTPHHGELERMGIKPGDIAAAAKKSGIVIMLKGPVIEIALPDGTVKQVSGGNAGLTVGGTGDALAGLTAGLIAQRMTIGDACVAASTIIKSAAEELFRAYGYAFGTRRVIEKIPHLLPV